MTLDELCRRAGVRADVSAIAGVLFAAALAAFCAGAQLTILFLKGV